MQELVRTGAHRESPWVQTSLVASLVGSYFVAELLLKMKFNMGEIVSFTPHNVYMRYGLVAIATVAAILLRELLDPILKNTLPLVTLFGAIAVAAWLGDFWATALVIISGYFACAYLFMEPSESLGLYDAKSLASFAAYLATSGIIVGFAEVRRSAQHRAEVDRERLRLTIASVGDAIITTDAHGRITGMNRPAESLTGWNESAALGASLAATIQIVDEHTRKAVANLRQIVKQGGPATAFAQNAMLITRDGIERPINGTVSSIRNAAGEFLGVILVIRDESDRRMYDRKLQASEATKSAMLQAALDCIISIDASGKIIEFNRAAEVTFGYSAQDVMGKDLAELIMPPEYREQHRRGLARFLATGQSDIFNRRIEVPGLTACGKEITLELSVTLSNADQRPIFTAFLRDVTALRLEERKIAARMQAVRLLASIVKASDDAIVSQTLEGTILSWNAAAERMFGYSTQEVVGRNIRFLIPNDRQEEEAELVARLRRGELVTNLVTRRNRKDGSQIDVSLTMSAVRNEQDETVGASNIARDFTERKRMEDRLKQISDELSQANRRKDEFLATLAHELRNPLAPLSNALQIIRMSQSAPDVIDEATSVMERQLAYLVRLVDDLLDISRIDRGKIDIRKSLVALDIIVRGAVETSRPAIAAATHELQIHLPAEHIFVDGDQTRLTQVIANLLNNAAKYTERGGRIELTVERQMEQAIITVRDNGIGISADMLPRVFDLFAQADRSVKGAQGGLGIGLSLAKKLVELHGGKIEALSDGLGKGSAFVVRLPLAPRTSDFELPATCDAAPQTPCHQLRVLVADDNIDSVVTLAKMLQYMGHDVRTAHDGERAVAVANDYQPDFIFLDIGMPKLSGFEACQRIRQAPWAHSLVAIALTGWGQDEDKRQSREAGFDQHLVKPINVDTLKKVFSSLKPSASTDVRDA